jgi:hypothetical protein
MLIMGVCVGILYFRAFQLLGEKLLKFYPSKYFKLDRWNNIDIKG